MFNILLLDYRQALRAGPQGRVPVVAYVRQGPGGRTIVKALGSHLILELYSCPAALLDDPQHVASVMTSAVEASGATLIKPFFHQFAPQGVSGVIIISESHFTIHTWPEFGYAAVDVFTCGDVIDMDVAAATLRKGLKAQSMQKMMLSRGMLDLPPEMIKHKPDAQSLPLPMKN